MFQKLLLVAAACALACPPEVLANQHDNIPFGFVRTASGGMTVVSAEGVFLEEARTVCGDGFHVYTKRRTLKSQELAWLRDLLKYLFNGTDFRGIELEEAVSRDPTTGLPNPYPEAKLQELLDDPAFAKWMGTGLTQSLLKLRRARAALMAIPNLNTPPNNPKLEMQRLPVRRYISAADDFYRRLKKKFGLKAEHNAVNCD